MVINMSIDPLIKKCYSPYCEWPYLQENFMKLPERYSFNLEEMNNYLFSVIDKVGLEPLHLKDGVSKYSDGYFGMGFTYRSGSKDPHHDAFKLFNEQGLFDGSAADKRTMKSTLMAHNVHHFERNFTEQTEHVQGPLKELLSRFKSLVTKVRIIELKPGESVHRHFDYPYYENVRLHAALKTNDQVEWWVDEQLYTLPADGNLYWFDTGKFHKIINKGSTSRIILSIHLSVYKDAQGNLVYRPEDNLIDLINNEKI